MLLLDDIALEGVHFPASLFMFRKIVFTLDGVLHDISDSEIRMDSVITREFLTRWIASFGWFHAPLATADLVKWGRLFACSRLPAWPGSQPKKSQATGEKSGHPAPATH